jgi:hypothetical protein
MKLCGTRSHRLTNIADKEALGGTETRNNAAQEVITEMGAKGDVTCRVDMDIYIAKAVMKRNMVIRSAGSTVFERTHGVEPSTTASWMVAIPDMEAEIAALSGDNAEDSRRLIALINSQVQSLMATHRATQDKRARNSAFLKDQVAARRNVVEFDLRKGDEVSYENTKGQQVKGKLLNMTEYADCCPIAAEVMLDTGRAVRVKYSSLKPCGIHRPPLMVSKVLAAAEVGKLVLYDNDVKDLVVGGRIIGTSDDGKNMEVHRHQPSDSGRSWMPSWKKKKRKVENCRDCPEGYEAVLELVLDTDVVMYGDLRKSLIVTEETRDRMRALGLID